MEPKSGRYMDNISPVTGQKICEVPRSDASDIEAAPMPRIRRAQPGAAQRHRTLQYSSQNRSAYRGQSRSDRPAETWDNGKPLRETTNADIPLTIDHFRYFAGCIRAQEGSIGQIDNDTVAYHFHEPLGVVGQIIPWNFPILMAAWKLAPALAAGNCAWC